MFPRVHACLNNYLKRLRISNPILFVVLVVVRTYTQVTLSMPTALYMFRTLAAGADPQSLGPLSSTSSNSHPNGPNIVRSGAEHSSSIGEFAAWRSTRISSLDSAGSLGSSSIGSLDDLTFDASLEVRGR